MPLEPSPVESRIRGFIDSLRKKLIDQSGRNALINFRPRPTSRTSIEVVFSDFDAIWKKLIQDEGRWRLVPHAIREVMGSEELSEEENAEDTGRSSLRYLTEEEINESANQGHLTVKLDQVRLRSNGTNIRRKADGVIKETGINNLYLAIGYLHWFESDNSEKERNSPLLLIPISLSVKTDEQGAKKTFEISHDGGELEPNTSLKLVLESQFDLKLPFIEEGESVTSYLNKVEKLIQGIERWSIVRTAHLAFFSFTKLRMYEDLDPAAWPEENSLENNELIQAILEGTDRGDDIPRYGEVEVHDEHELAHKIPLVTEADSSQHTAILKVLEGKHTVIEGPPGTGKSQTITNIIATTIAAGKTVLFVSEKQAALNVVWSNLNSIGLSDFCLELHSSKARKDEVHKSIDQRIRKTFCIPQGLKAVKSEWIDSMQELLEYVRNCSQLSGPKEAPLYSYFGTAVALREQSLPSLRSSFRNIPANKATYEKAKGFLVRFASHISNPEVFKDHPWRGFKATNVLPGDDPEIIALFDSLTNHINSLGGLEQKLSSISGVEYPLPISLIRDWKGGSLNNLFQSAESLDQSLIARFYDATTEAIVLESIKKRHNYNASLHFALRVLTEIAAVNPSEIEWVFTTARDLELKSCSKFSCSQMASWLPYLGELGNILEEVLSKVNDLKQIGVGTAHSIAELRRMLPRISICAAAPSAASQGIEAPLAFPGVLESLKEAKATSERINQRREVLLHEIAINDAPESEEVRELKTTIRATGGKLFSLLNSDYRRAKKETLRFLKNPKSFKVPFIIDLLEKCHLWMEEEQAFKENIQYKNVLGSRFKGSGTNWEDLESVCRWGIDMASLSFSFDAIAKMADAGTQAQVRRISEDVNACLKRYETALEKCHPLVVALLGTAEPDSVSIEQSPGYIIGCDNWIKRALQRIEVNTLSTDFTVMEIKQAAEAATQAQEIQKSLDADEVFHQRLSPAAKGMQSDWERIESLLAWYQEGKEKIPSDLLKWILKENFGERMNILTGTLTSAAQEHRVMEELLEKISHFGHVEEEWLFDGEFRCWKDLPPRFERLREQKSLLPQWVIFHKLSSEAESLGVSVFVEEAIKQSFPVDRMADVYELTVCETHGFKQMSRHENLTTFSHQAHEGSRIRFGRRDKRLLAIHREEVAAKASDRRVPPGISKGPAGDWTERGLLNREIGKSRKHISIRELMRRAGTAVRALKPCVMMSPLSVASFLDPHLERFDLVVMDEASQIRPEDALGAIARGKQLVVVGDTKQMPPPKNYQVVLDDYDDEEDDVSAAQGSESILEAALSAFSPVYRLKWHYRSQHEDLIKFSNHHYYNNELIIFPSSGRLGHKMGIVFNFIEGAHVSKAAGDKGVINNKEAEAVAKAAIHHLIHNPNESLLVATMNIHQQDLIESWIDRLTENNGVARAAYAQAEEKELFLLKNLENIQGHQSDVVMISTTYGKDPQSGRVMQRFGPLNGKDGRRRLNVLFTRAKLRNEIFTSMTYQDINGNPGNETGVNDLRNYLRFAQEGILYEEGIDTGRPPDSEFEESVMNVIRSVGLVPTPQVGVASYRIDIGVSMPGRPGEYLIGIECDGATYHSSRSARDRDRLREEVLVSRGWSIYRIWSTDWFYQHEEAKKRLLQKLKDITAGSTL
jgi:hypothetical protein